jgi:cysteine synthase B
MTLIKNTMNELVLAEATGIEHLIGHTPLIPLRRVTGNISPQVKVFAKAEWFNPGGSVKDRPAMNIIRTAMANGELVAGKRLLDSTSGNMGIAYATYCAALGIQVTLAIPANASRERITILRALGAEIILTDPLEGSDGALLVAREMAARDPKLYFYANQYDNPANWQAHYRSTGPEIVEQTEGTITHFVAGLGTTGTLTGVGRYLRDYNPDVKLVAVQPAAAFHGLEGLKYMPTAIKPAIFDPTLAGLTLEVETENAHSMTRRLAREEGLFVGISSGAAAFAALELAAGLKYGVVVTVFPDSGFKYLSDSKLWSEK